MPELNFHSLDDFINAAQAGLSEAAGAYSRTFDGEVSLTIGQSGGFDAATLPQEFWKPGLAIALTVAGAGVAILIPTTSGLVPDWCAEPDATGKSKLATFAQEWGMNLLPEDFFPDDNQAAIVPDLGKAVIDYAQLGSDAAYLIILAEKDGKTKPVFMIWPVVEPAELLKQPAVEADDGTDDLPPPPPFLGGADDVNVDYGAYAYEQTAFDGRERKPLTLEDLPGFTHSVLKIRLPLAVVLARAKKPIKMILELGIGSVIQFDKSCDDPIELEIDNTIVGRGEAVKVGDKFGIRLSTILLPIERFHKVEIRRDGDFSRHSPLPQIIGKAPIRSLEVTSGK
ncbi:MAG: FliM/FliN family flagellar motor switch protein [Planctomycetaceae bacterium]|jgi:flagellar motor switch protein FliN|nr:FliM/FliN family flagellar motor switch protein [Planctomycetaceae bacterium]